MNIRLASVEDLESINRIHGQAVEMKMATADTVPYSAGERMEWYRNHKPDTYPAYVAEADGRVIGYLSFSAYRPRREALKYVAEISYFLDKDYRGMGIGSKLLSFGLSVAPDFGYKFVVAILLGHNEASIRLLKKFGFEEWGRLPGIAEFDGLHYDHLYYGIDLQGKQAASGERI